MRLEAGMLDWDTVVFVNHFGSYLGLPDHGIVKSIIFQLLLLSSTNLYFSEAMDADGKKNQKPKMLFKYCYECGRSTGKE